MTPKILKPDIALPCPYCGENATLEFYRGEWFAGCHPTAIGDTAEKAIAAYEARVAYIKAGNGIRKTEVQP